MSQFLAVRIPFIQELNTGPFCLALYKNNLHYHKTDCYFSRTLQTTFFYLTFGHKKNLIYKLVNTIPLIRKQDII